MVVVRSSVQLTAFISDNPSSNPAKAYSFSVKKERGRGRPIKKVGLRCKKFSKLIFLLEQPDELQGDSGSSAPSYLKLLSNPYVLVATGSVWFSTTAMALLEPCLPIWLMDTIKPTVIHCLA